MWCLSVNFTTLHYAWIVFMGLLSLPVLYPYGNLQAIDAYFFGASASTDSGLNTAGGSYDCKDLALYQQLYIYVIPMLTNLGFVNIIVVVVRLHWFNKRIEKSGRALRASGGQGRGRVDDAQMAREDGEGAAEEHAPASLARLTSREREELGGVEYRSLKLLLRIITAYYLGMHLVGGIGLLGWIRYASPRYTTYLQEQGLDSSWWALYTAQSAMDNLGFTLTQDSMVHFRDAVWPLLLLSFLGFAGETLYPVFLRLAIWTTAKLVPASSPMQEPLAFLLRHPRRCYTLLFASGPTWALLAIVVALSLVDTLLIVVLDLRNPQVAGLSVSQRVVAALFQAVASRHAGMTPYSLADVSPAVQCSLLVMMYISVFPIAMTIRTSNTYRGGAVGLYRQDLTDYNETKAGVYLVQHMQQQLGFDLWYIFLGTFCLAVLEAPKLRDLDDPSFKIFPILFEVVSAYANVGISLGHPTTTACLSAKFSVPGKLVVCAVMIRGRHRGLPYRLDRAVMLPDDHLLVEDSAADQARQPS